MKRFTETTKWADVWFMDLPVKWKLAWVWILDNCDHAGIVEANPRLMTFVIGEPIDGDELMRIMSGRVTKPKPGKWFVPSFIEFQYGNGLNTQNSAHRGVIRKLAEAGIQCPVTITDSPCVAPSKGLPSPCQGAQDKDKDYVGDDDSADCPGVTDAEIYAAYPRKVAKQSALKAIAAARKRPGVTAESLLAATQAYAGAVAKWPEADRTFVPHPATWFNRGSYDDDPATWERLPPAPMRNANGFVAPSVARPDIYVEPAGWRERANILWPDTSLPGTWAELSSTVRNALISKR